ncbi:phenylacetyl-CoA ligase [Candidatus Terasakiella magnetica]|uniref:Phenylacetate-coenzyme A ligase n=1 Tax=Candidatus Terasakiella magnetica TaxID=1867952 RepID=A0A1C3RDX3_9PROT|nr:phenylacetate--CoA ligase PaaK [Candidatus Terasakiella magnetica]SCA55497.1 phenylacetyl-CoA ligase [Candidatus Terasakiella magnetica]
MQTTDVPLLGELDPIEKASVDELRALQFKRMKWSLEHAYQNVAYYRAKCVDAQVHPDDLKHLDDLQKFPFTTKEDLRKAYPFDSFAVPMEEVVRVHASSGTTGKPTVVGYTKQDLKVWAGVVARSLRAAGVSHHDRVHVAYGYGLFTGGMGAHYGAEELGCTVIPMSGGQTEKQVQLMRDFDPDVIMVTPSYMLVIADEMERQGLDPREIKLRCGIFGAEPWTNKMRDEMEARLGIDCLDIYGLSEVIGPGVAQECLETKDGPTIWEDHFYPEIVDTNFNPLTDGEMGEMVFTSLTKEAMPVIRYRTKDLTKLLPGTARTMRRFDKITGRSDDMMIIRGVNVFPSQIEEQVLRDERLSPHYHLILSRKGHMDSLAVQVERREDGQSNDEDIKKKLSHHIKSYIGISTSIDVLEPGAIPRSQGKAVRVTDNRPKE